jgi:glucose-1-phosphate thymidylyltransferase
MKGVILAGGSGTRLRPLTSVVGKQLLPVFDKPMIYYPLSTLIHSGVNQILIISTEDETPKFKRLLGDGSRFGISLSYEIQSKPEGLAKGVELSKNFVGQDNFWFVLGDNLFHGPDFGVSLKNLSNNFSGSLIFGYRVHDPRAYGVIRFEESTNKISGLFEKPENLISNWAIPGLYLFDHSAFERCKNLQPSMRGEFEIMDLLSSYLDTGQLEAKRISRGNAWFDLGTPESLLTGATFVHAIQSRQGLLVGSPEEAALNSGFIKLEKLQEKLSEGPKNYYYETLLNILSQT